MQSLTILSINQPWNNPFPLFVRIISGIAYVMLDTIFIATEYIIGTTCNVDGINENVFAEIINKVPKGFLVAGSDVVKLIKMSKDAAVCLVIRQYEVRIVAVCMDIYNLVRSDSHQFDAGRYSAPFHTQTDNYLANLRIFIGISEEYISFLTLFTDKSLKIQSYGTCLLPHIACNAAHRFRRRV